MGRVITGAKEIAKRVGRSERWLRRSLKAPGHWIREVVKRDGSGLAVDEDELQAAFSRLPTTK